MYNFVATIRKEHAPRRILPKNYTATAQHVAVAPLTPRTHIIMYKFSMRYINHKMFVVQFNPYALSWIIILGMH